MVYLHLNNPAGGGGGHIGRRILWGGGYTRGSDPVGEALPRIGFKFEYLSEFGFTFETASG
jgi:hypothetical protein